MAKSLKELKLVFEKEQIFLTERDKSDLISLNNLWLELRRPLEVEVAFLTHALAEGESVILSPHFTNLFNLISVVTTRYATIVHKLILKRQRENIVRSENLFIKSYKFFNPTVPLPIFFMMLSIFGASIDPGKIAREILDAIIGSTSNGITLDVMLMKVNDEVKEALIRYFSKHIAVDTFYKSVMRILDRVFFRTGTILQTEVIHGFRATYMKYSSYYNLYSWVWVALMGACEYCAGQHGTVHKASEDMRTHPRCRCLQMPVWDKIPDEGFYKSQL